MFLEDVWEVAISCYTTYIYIFLNLFKSTLMLELEDRIEHYFFFFLLTKFPF